jgi:hypothetical protein
MNIEKRNVNALILLGAIELITAAFGLISLTVFEQVGQLVWNLPLIAAVSIAAGINVVVGIGAMVVHDEFPAFRHNAQAQPK